MMNKNSVTKVKQIKHPNGKINKASNLKQELKKSNKEKELSKNDTLIGSIERIKRLEEIHYKRKKETNIYDKINFLLFLIIILVGNLFFVLIIVFLIIALHDSLIYPIAIILGLCSGYIFSHLIHDIKKIFNDGNIYSNFLLIITSIINIIAIVLLSKYIFEIFNIKGTLYNPLGIAIVFSLCYIIPYLIETSVRRIN
jgi:hypothetical protein